MPRMRHRAQLIYAFGTSSTKKKNTNITLTIFASSKWPTIWLFRTQILYPLQVFLFADAENCTCRQCVITTKMFNEHLLRLGTITVVNNKFNKNLEHMSVILRAMCVVLPCRFSIMCSHYSHFQACTLLQYVPSTIFFFVNIFAAWLPPPFLENGHFWIIAFVYFLFQVMSVGTRSRAHVNSHGFNIITARRCCWGKLISTAHPHTK